MRIAAGWPWSDQLLAAFRRLIELRKPVVKKGIRLVHRKHRPRSNRAGGRAVIAAHHQNRHHNLARITGRTNPPRLMKDGGYR